MRTTVRLDDRLLAEAKPITLPTGGSGGLQPGVRIDSYALLLDLMESEE